MVRRNHKKEEELHAKLDPHCGAVLQGKWKTDFMIW